MNFTNDDIKIIRRALKELQVIEWKILYLRFWENYSIFEIADSLEMKWEEVNLIIENLFVQLKDVCLKDPTFSKSKFMTLSQLPQQHQEENFHEAI